MKRWIALALALTAGCRHDRVSTQWFTAKVVVEYKPKQAPDLSARLEIGSPAPAKEEKK